MSATNGSHPITRYGHIAAAMRDAMDAKGWNTAELNRRLGRTNSHPSVYQYLNMKCGPTRENAARISKVLDIPMETLLARGATPATAPAPQRTPGGEIHIKLELTVALKDAATVLRLLLDAGLLPASDIL